MNLSNLLSQLKSLNLPLGHYVINSSGVLAAHGIREANDLDIVVTPEFFKQLKRTYPMNTRKGFEIIEIGDLEILGPGSQFTSSPEIATVEEQIQAADIIDGIPYCKLELLRKFKQKMGRDKDLRDIELIDNYLSARKH